jgi:hypothetical protein
LYKIFEFIEIVGGTETGFFDRLVDGVSCFLLGDGHGTLNDQNFLFDESCGHSSVWFHSGSLRGILFVVDPVLLVGKVCPC